MGFNWGGAGSGAMSGVGTGATFGPWGAAIGGVAGGLLGGFSGGDEDELQLPQYQEDPYYKKSQDELFGMGSGILQGDIPEYYKNIGESGGERFEDMLGMAKRDVTTSVNEDMARRKVRSLRGTNIGARAIADMSKKFRWDDYLKSIQGKKFLLGKGEGMVSGVRTAGQQEANQRNAFNLNAYKMFSEGEAKEDTSWTSMLTSGIGALGKMSSMFKGGGDTGSGGGGGNYNVTDYASDFWNSSGGGAGGPESFNMDYYSGGNSPTGPSYGIPKKKYVI